MKALWLVAGFLFLALGLIGIAVPVLPTVPFLLLTSLCFMKGSQRFHAWFKRTVFYKNYLENFVLQGGMAKKQKIKLLVLTALLLAFPFFMVPSPLMKVGILLLLAFKCSFFAFKIKTLDEAETK